MITVKPFGTLKDGTAVACYTLAANAQEGSPYVAILDYGATVQAICVPDRDDNLRDVVLGYDTPIGYEEGDMYIGSVVGRHANRIGCGKFTLNGKEYQLECNDGPNHLHGGLNGYHQRMFDAEIDGDTLRLTLLSPDGDQGYPGNLKLTVEYTFTSELALKIHYLAETDQDTVINVTNHSYFDLSGGINPTGQCLRLAASAVTDNDKNTLPTGEITPVEGTPFDFRSEKPLADGIHSGDPRITAFKGYDHNFILDTDRESPEMAWLQSPDTGITLTMSTDLPGMQLYSGNFVNAPCGKQGKAYGQWSAVCLESQSFPNGMAIEHFPKPILRAGDTYDHTTVYRFGISE